MSVAVKIETEAPAYAALDGLVERMINNKPVQRPSIEEVLAWLDDNVPQAHDTTINASIVRHAASASPTAVIDADNVFCRADSALRSSDVYGWRKLQQELQRRYQAILSSWQERHSNFLQTPPKNVFMAATTLPLIWL